MPPITTDNKADVYNVGGVKYIREDLVERKMDSIMERIAIAQEKQIAFYERWEKQMHPIMKIMENAIKKRGMF